MPPKPYFMKGLTPEIVKRAEEELGETEEIRTQSLKDLRRLIREVPDFEPCLEDRFLLRFLRTRKFNAERALKTLKNYYTFKARYSGIYTDFKPSHVKKLFEEGHLGALQYRDSKDDPVGIMFIGKIDYEKFSIDEMFACIMIGTEVGLDMEASQITGYSMVLDFSGFDLHMAKMYASPTLMYRFVFAIQDCIPSRIKSYHVVNEPLYCHMIFSIAKSFLSDKLRKRLYLHGNNLKHLHKYISPDILPQELGGKQPHSSEFIKKEYVPRVLGMEEHFMRMNKYGFKDEALRQLTKDNPNAIIS